MGPSNLLDSLWCDQKHHKFGNAVCGGVDAFTPCLCCNKGHDAMMCSRGMSLPRAEERRWQDAGLEAGAHLDWRSLDLPPLSTRWESICSGAQGAAAFMCSRPMAGDDLSRWVGPGLIVGLTPHLPAPKIAVDAGRLASDWQTASTKQPGAWDLAPAPVLWPMRAGLTEVTQAFLHKVFCSQSVEPRTPNKPGAALQPLQPCLVHQIAN